MCVQCWSKTVQPEPWPGARELWFHTRKGILSVPPECSLSLALSLHHTLASLLHTFLALQTPCMTACIAVLSPGGCVIVLYSPVVQPRSVSGVEMRKRQAAHIEAPPQAPGQPRPNTCCLCWCGCCKCLWWEHAVLLCCIDSLYGLIHCLFVVFFSPIVLLKEGNPQDHSGYSTTPY